MIGGDGCSGTHLKGEPKGDVIPRKRLRGDDVDTAAAGGYARGEGEKGTSARIKNTRKQRKSSELQKPKPPTGNQ